MKKITEVLEKWGYYLLAVLCVGVILLSMVWTKKQDAAFSPDAQALSDESQRLSSVSPEPTKDPVYLPPCGILRGYAEEAVYFPETEVWQRHPGTDFDIPAGETVYALRGGTVRLSGEEILVEHGNESERYRGVRELTVQDGQRIAAGDPIGLSGAEIPFEGCNHICVVFYRDGVPRDGWEAQTSGGEKE